MFSTSRVVYPGCNVTNTITLAAANVPACATKQFKSQLALQYKAGNDIWCDPSCLFLRV